MLPYDQVIGWIGTLLILTAFTLNAWKYIKSDGYSYLIMNLLGALALTYAVYSRQVWSNVFLEIVWGGVALIGIIKVYIKKHS